MNEILLIPVITSITQLFKGSVKKKYIPIISIICGLCLSILFGILNKIDITASIVEGITAGLGACGLYSGSKTLAKK